MATFRETKEEGIHLLAKMDTPFLDTTVLLSHAAGMTKEKLLASYPDIVSDEIETKFREFITLRLDGIPVAYIVGEKEFYGRPFIVDERVLTPRPDTEVLVEAGLAATEKLKIEGQPAQLKVADVCTGSGCVALTVALEDDNIQMTASDLSPDAAEVFQKNRMSLCSDKDKERISFRLGNLLADDHGSYDIILSNPPYLTSSEVDDKRAASWPEPEMALEGGEDGLDLIRTLTTQSRDRLNKNGYLIMEAGFDQMAAIEEIYQQNGFSNIIVHKDLAGHDRVIEGRLT